MREDVEKVSALDVKYDFLESDASFGLELLVLGFVPRKVLHLRASLAHCVPNRHTRERVGRIGAWRAPRLADGMNAVKCVILTFMKRTGQAVVHLSPRGQLTLPIRVRKALGVEGGDDLVIVVEAGRAILEPAVIMPVERYSEERSREFEKASRMSPQEIKRARRKWRL